MESMEQGNGTQAEEHNNKKNTGLETSRGGYEGKEVMGKKTRMREKSGE